MRAAQPGIVETGAMQPRSAGALEVEVRGTVRAAKLPAVPETAVAEAQAPETEAGGAEIVEAGTAETAHRRTLRALRPATVRPRQAGLIPGPARQRPRPAGLRPRRVSTRLHPTGVRACSDVSLAEPPTAALLVPQARPSHTGNAPQRLRLTRRGRVVLAVFAAVVVSLIGLAAANGARAGDSAAPAGTAGHSMTRIVVQPGQTLWTIAMRADPQADPRQVVQEIIAANALRDGSIQAGQHLLVPRG
jgi:LysM repeat protein